MPTGSEEWEAFSSPELASARLSPLLSNIPILIHSEHCHCNIWWLAEHRWHCSPLLLFVCGFRGVWGGFRSAARGAGLGVFALLVLAVFVGAAGGGWLTLCPACCSLARCSRCALVKQSSRALCHGTSSLQMEANGIRLTLT